MKKSIVTLGALAVIGGLGLAGSAQAVVYFGSGSTAPSATALTLNPGSTGHNLILPYYTVQGASTTMMTIVNTDTTNGKAVKVRFRGAANSDDVLDFTVLMSPGDEWTAAISQDPATGLARLVTTDNSCTVPGGPINALFKTDNLPSFMTPSQLAAQTREGYVEIMNTADIPPKTNGGGSYDGPQGIAGNAVPNSLYYAILHNSKGVPPCAQTWTTGGNIGLDALATLEDMNTVTATTNPGVQLLGDYGLDAPTGGLSGSWAILNQETMAQYSGNDTAIKASSAASTLSGGRAPTRVTVSPQRQNALGIASNTVTADPMLTGGRIGPNWNPVKPLQSIVYWDVPDLSTPMGITAAVGSGTTAALTTPTAQADAVASLLGKTTVHDEYVKDPQGSGGVPMSTDWVISQPTRRYFAIVAYDGTPTNAQILYNANVVQSAGPTVWGSGVGVTSAAPAALPYAGLGQGAGNLQLQGNTTAANGPVLCLIGASVEMRDREEKTDSSVDFSPGVSKAQLCGEVATLTWGNSPLNAALTNTIARTTNLAGWATLALPTGDAGASYGLPALGWAGITAKGVAQSFGFTWPLRWE